MLKNDFVVGYTNIENKKYAGASGKHKPDETAVDTTNGAGPHNLQIFVLTPDGTIMTCLPGYWKAEDLAKELTLAKQLSKVWQDKGLSLEEKQMQFSQLQLDHINSHDQAMRGRSHLQGFDLQYELKNRPNSDFFYSARAIDPVTMKTPPKNVKSVDIVMHQRLAAHPFEPYERFDVASYADYGKPIYDKHEQFLDASGKIAEGSDLGSAPMIGNTPKAHPIQTQAKRTGSRVARSTVNHALRYGIRAILH
jgi:hypothetical protein